jgi:hypothetical protein
MVRKIGTPEDEARNAETLQDLEGSVTQAKPSIHTKMVAVMGTLGAEKPQGSNRHFSYDYWTADQLSALFRSRFVAQGLSFMADVVDYSVQEGKTSKGGQTWLTTIRVLFSITDTVTGEIISGHGIGQGDDPGDKGSNKAFAGALKYWLLKTFLLGGEDAEADEATDRRSETVRESSRAPVRDVVVGDSDIEGIERGGRSTNATEVQVRRVRNLARDLRYGADATNDLIGDILGSKADLPGDPEERGPAFVRHLEGLTADDIGKVIQYMEAMSEEQVDER